MPLTMSGYYMNALFLGFGSVCTFSLAYATYSHRIMILENCNYQYLNIRKYINNLKPITIMETIKLKSATIYHIKLLGAQFIVSDLNIDIDRYNSLRNSLVIPHSPEDILDAILIQNDKEIDITDVSKLLIGPFLDQIHEKNVKWIFEYLQEKHNYTDITSFTITLINGKKNKLKNRNI